MTTTTTDTGMKLRDLCDDDAFLGRALRKRDPMHAIDALRRLAHVFATSPADGLQQLVEIAVDATGADSAGISLDESADPARQNFRWIAVAGTFAEYLGGTTPRFASPCGTCLDRGAPQLYSVTKPFYDSLGVTAREIPDGILIPWHSVDQQGGDARGTLWAVSHREGDAFDIEDYRLLASLADFAAIAVRYDQQHKAIVSQARFAAAGEMANRLAHRINNPLQGLTNTLFLASQPGQDAHLYAQQALDDLARLSRTVSQLLSLDYNAQ